MEVNARIYVFITLTIFSSYANAGIRTAEIADVYVADFSSTAPENWGLWCRAWWPCRGERMRWRRAGRVRG